MHPLEVALIAVAVLAGYELARWLILRSLRRYFHQRAQRFAERHGTRIDLYKFGGKLLVREALLNDLVVAQAMATAVQSGQRPEDVRRNVESYIDEIVPAFSLGAYYQLGMTLARAAIHAVYRPVIDAASVKRLASLPQDATAVFVINHRLNFDYLVVALALARQVAVSYAVGEWARVFPLDALFKAFGGFFVRRGFPDALYHTVLRRYLQLITRQGVTQGIFLEGGLTRDGALRAPKTGLLGGLLELASDTEFTRELYFVPVGINYDRVLEDEVLLAELRGRNRPPSPGEKLLGMLRLAWVLPSRLVANGFRAITGRLHRSGYVAVAFGAPVRWKTQAQAMGATSQMLEDEDQRRDVARRVAVELMARIARSIPATPVTLVSRALLGSTASVSVLDLARSVDALRRELSARGAPTALGREFDLTRRGRVDLQDIHSPEIAALEEQLLDAEEAEAITRLGIERLARRKVLRVSGASVQVLDSTRSRELLAYYARSLAVLDSVPTSVPSLEPVQASAP